MKGNMTSHGDGNIMKRKNEKCDEVGLECIVTEAILKAGQSDTDDDPITLEGHSLAESADQSHIIGKTDSLVNLRSKTSLDKIPLDEISSSSLLDEGEIINLLDSEYSVRRVRSDSNLFHETLRQSHSQEERTFFVDSIGHPGFLDTNEKQDIPEMGNSNLFVSDLSHTLPRDSGDQEPVLLGSLFIRHQSNESIRSSQCSSEFSTPSGLEAAAILMENMDEQVNHLFDYLSRILPMCGKYAKIVPVASSKERQRDVDTRDDDVDDESCPQVFHVEKEDAVKQQCGDFKDLEMVLKNARNIAGEMSDCWKHHRHLFIEIMKESARLENIQQRSGERTRRLCDVIKTLKSELKSVQMFLQEKEEEWLTTERSLRADTLFLQSGISEIMKNQPSEPRLWSTLDSLMCIQHNREKAFALDCAKQNKINELRLLIYKQQLQLAECKEKNNELESELENVLGGVPQLMNTNNNDDDDMSLLTNVLYCDHCQYVPGCSTNPQYAALKVLNIGGSHENLCSREEQIFNPCILYKGPDCVEKESQYSAEEMLKDLTNCGPASQIFTLKEQTPLPTEQATL